jgi:hypothetical protein
VKWSGGVRLLVIPFLVRLLGGVLGALGVLRVYGWLRRRPGVGK